MGAVTVVPPHHCARVQRSGRTALSHLESRGVYLLVPEASLAPSGPEVSAAPPPVPEVSGQRPRPRLQAQSCARWSACSVGAGRWPTLG